MTVAKAYNCGCPGGGPCPKIKGTSDEENLGEDTLDIVAWNKPTKGKPYLGAGIYIAEYFDGHFRNDGNNGNSSTQCIALHRVAQNKVCDGFHPTQAMAQGLVAEINALLKKNGNQFTIRNHQNGVKMPAEYWNRVGITDVRDQLVAALAAWPT